MASKWSNRKGNSQRDQLKSIGINSTRRSFDKQMHSLASSQLKAIRSLSDDMTKEEKRAIKSSSNMQRKAMNEQMKRAKKYYKQNKKYMTDSDKLAYKVMLTNRKKDFRNLSKESKKAFKDISSDFEDSMSDIGAKISKVTESLRDWNTALNVGDIAGGIKDSAQTVFDSQKELQKLTGSQLKDLQSLSNSFRGISKAMGNKIAVSDYMESATTLAEMGYKDLDFLKEMGTVLSEVGKATSTSTDQMQKLAEYADSFGDSKGAKDFGNIIKSITTNANLHTSGESLMGAFQQSYDSVAAKSNGDEDQFNKLMQDQLKMSAVASSNYFDYDSMRELLENARGGDQETLTGLSALKINTNDIKKLTQSGNYTEASAQIVSAMVDNINNIPSEELKKQLLDMTGIGDVDSLRKINKETLAKSIKESESSLRDSSNRDYLQDYFDNQLISPIEKFKNWLSNTKLGTAVDNTLGNLQMDFTDILLLGNMLGGTLSKLGKIGLSKLGNLTNIFSVPSALGSVAKVGSTLGTGVSSVASGLGSTAVAGTGSALAVGGSSILGGLLGAGGIFSGLKSIVQSFKETDADKKSEKRWQGATKLGMVGTGATTGAVLGSVVPVVGTAAGALIGSGIGGLASLLKGDKVGSAIKDFVDSATDKFKSSFSKKNVKNTFKPLADDYASTVNSMKKTNTTLVNDLNTKAKKSGFFSNLASGIKSAFSKKGSSSSATIVDGSHKTGLDSVPFDGYVAELHKDEAVLTRQQAEQWRNQQNGSSIKQWFGEMMGSARKSIATAPKLTMTQDLTANNPSDIVKSTWKYLTGLGYSKQATAGILGNMKQESGVDPTAIQSGGKGPAAGIVQWENYTKKSDRWKAMADYASSKNKDWTDLYSQLDWMDQELRGKDPTTASLLRSKVGGYDNFKQLTDVPTATRVFEEAFERAGIPNMKNRYSSAQQYYTDLNAYAKGTPWVPDDQVAVLHKGEMVVPAQNNPFGNNSTVATTTSTSSKSDSDVSELIDVVRWGILKLDKRLEETNRSQPTSVTPTLANTATRTRKTEAVFTF